MFLLHSFLNSCFQFFRLHAGDFALVVERVEVKLYPTVPAYINDAEEPLRPSLIFRSAVEVAEADRMHSELMGDATREREWQVSRIVKHDSNGMEFVARFGFDFSLRLHLLTLTLK